MHFAQHGVFNRVSSTTTGPSTSDSSTDSPVASSSIPSSASILIASSTPSETLRITSAPNVPGPSSTTVATITSARSTQALTPSSSQSSPQSSTGGTSFFHNKPAMIAVFSAAGVFVLVVVLIVGIVVLRWKRRKDLVESALDFSPTTEHLVIDDSYSRGGGGSGALISRSSGSLSSEGRGTRLPRVPSVTLGATPSLPALAPAPIPAPREMQQRGFGTGYIGDHWLDRETSGARYAYGNSAQPYYDTVRQQQPPPPPPQPQQLQYQQQQLQYLPQQQSRSLRRQQREERPLPPDLPTDVGPIPSSLMPSSQSDTAVFNVPFATTATKPSRLSTDGALGGGGGGGINRTWGSRTSTRERRQTQQVPLPPPPTFPRKIPDTLAYDDEGLEDIDVSVDEDRLNRSRILKVRRFWLAVAFCSWLTGIWHDRLSMGDILIYKPPRGFVYFWSFFPCSSTACWACVRRYE
jgi:hypothetical protein